MMRAEVKEEAVGRETRDGFEIYHRHRIGRTSRIIEVVVREEED